MKRMLLLLLGLIVLSCQKDELHGSHPPEIGTVKFDITPVSGSVAGIVIDENNAPVVNASIKIGTHILNTNSRGLFNTESILLDKYITTVKVEVNGYHTAYRSFSANETKNYVSIKLIPKDLAGTFSSDAAELVNLPNGSSLSFQANSVVLKGTNTPYTGSVNVYASYIDPTSSDFGSTMPGSLMAEDATRFYVLRSTGMIAVEMEGAGGEPLQLATGKPATVKLAIPSSLLGVAPTTIDTWSLDARGIWMKEGTATRVGNAYEFEATHFSFWNCDVPTTAIYLNVNVKDNNGNNLINQLVSLTSSTTFGTTWGITDGVGNVAGFVPAHESHILKAYPTPTCNTSPYYSQNIGPFGSASSVIVVVTPPTSTTYTIIGTVNDCSGNPVASGSVFLYTGMYYFQHISVTNGSFSATFTNCNPVTDITLVATDDAGNQQSTSLTVAVTGNTINAGALTACGTSLYEFINYQLDGAPFIIHTNDPFHNVYAVADPSSTFILGYSQVDNDLKISLKIDGGGVGTFPVTSSDSFIINYYPTTAILPGGTSTISTYGAIGQYIEGNFNISFIETFTTQTHSLTGTFRLKRTQ